MIADLTRLLLLITCFSCLTSNSQNQISQLQDWTTIPKFKFVFDESPKVDIQHDQNQLPLTDYSLNLENGTKYVCSIPDIKRIEEQSLEDAESEIMDHMTPEQIRSKIETNFEVSIRGKCIRKSEGFWLFEICPFKEVRQIHTDGNRELLAFSLGKFFRSSWDEDGNLVQEFQHGTDNRSCKAIFNCGLKRSSADSVSFVEAREPTPLKYEMKLETSTLCTQEQKSTSPYSMLYALNSKCIFLNKGWWSYEFCHLAHIRQFHSERVKAEPVAGESGVRFQTVTTASFILGRFPDNASNSEFVNNQTKLVVPSDPSSQPYFSQTFTDGSECDLTGKKRQTEIRFTCNKNIESAKFASIKELKTCSYVAEIEVPSLCTHPKFSTKDPVIYNIHCKSQKDQNDAVSVSTASESPDSSSGPLQKIVQDSTAPTDEAVQLPGKSAEGVEPVLQNSAHENPTTNENIKDVDHGSRKLKLDHTKESNENPSPDNSQKIGNPAIQPEIAQLQRSLDNLSPDQLSEGPTPEKSEEITIPGQQGTSGKPDRSATDSAPNGKQRPDTNTKDEL